MEFNKRDFLYHLGLEWIEGKTNARIRDFSDVRYILLGGKPRRMKNLARNLEANLELGQIHSGIQEVEEATKAGRYVMYKIGPVLSVSHGMGRPSLSILLEELAKLLFYAKKHSKDLLAQPVYFLRLGTCGSLGVKPGNLILSTEALMPDLNTGLTKYELDQKVSYPSTFCPNFLQEILNFSKKNKPLLPVHKGKTITADDFYQGQGRFDGYFKSSYSESERQTFFEKAYKLGVRNFEMEAAELASFCNRPDSPLSLSAATLCVGLVDRMQGDQVTNSLSEINSWEQSLLKFASQYICDAIKRI
ncbi:MAG: hypothetical protein AB8G05_08855 [Oligoflexales bacterium]